MVHSGNDQSPVSHQVLDDRPILAIRRIGLVSRDYRNRFPNHYRDFSFRLAEVLNFLDSERCDSILFSLYGIVSRQDIVVQNVLASLKNVRAVFLEEFEDGRKRQVKRFVVHHRSVDGWREYEIHQKFGSLTDRPDLEKFVEAELPKRSLGNCCVLLCGESNGVKYSRDRRRVEDTFGLRAKIPKSVTVIINPVHDRMTRFEMNLKRKFLSEDDRWVISVWNKGKTDREGKTRDGQAPAWSIFRNGRPTPVSPIPQDMGLEVGILDLDAHGAEQSPNSSVP